MAKTKIDKDDIKRLVENTSNPTSTTSVYSAKYVDDNFANENQTIDFDISNEEPDQTGTVAKTSTWLWQYLTQSVNFLWLKLKDLFSESTTTNDNYLPKIDDVNKNLVKSNINDDGTTPKYGANKIWHSGNVGGNDIKDGLGLTDYLNYNKHDIFISGLPTYSYNFNDIAYIGSYKVSGGYSNAPSRNCGTNTSITASMKGTLNVFRSGVNDWGTLQQLFWVLDGVTEQYQRSYDGGGTTWTDWKRLIKCDDYATTDRGGIISAANISELFRAPGLIQLWNETGLELSDGVFHLTDLSIVIPIQNSLYLGGRYDNDIVDLTSERRYRVTYEVHCVKKKGEGLIFIRIENNAGELYSIGDYIFDWAIRKSYRFSVILTNTDVIRPSIEVDSRLTIEIYNYNYQVSVEEIKFPQFNPA